MYLSRMKLDMSKRSTQVALSSLNKIHGAVEEAYDYQLGQRTRKLWRIDQLSGDTYLMILSEKIPRFDSLLCQFGTTSEECITKDYTPLLERVRDGSYWRFRLTANPTICKSQGKDKRGKRVAVISPELQVEWLIRKSKQHGFCVTGNTFQVVKSEWVNFHKKDKHLISAICVTYEGFLRVENTEKFRTALCDGIGTEKAYGMGMMTIMKYER